jgi:hypothetical protein
MLDFFDFGVFLVDTLSQLGDFLLSDPVPIPTSFISSVAGALDRLGLHYGADLVSEFLSSDLTIATMILGPSLVVFLCIKLIKFFVHVLT